MMVLALIATAAVIIGGYTAFAVSVTNPFTVGTGHQTAGLEMYSGAWYRVVLLLIMVVGSSI